MGSSEKQYARAGDKQEAREEDDGNERRAQAVSDPRFQLIINSNIPEKVIARSWGREGNVGDNWRS